MPHHFGGGSDVHASLDESHRKGVPEIVRLQPLELRALHHASESAAQVSLHGASAIILENVSGLVLGQQLLQFLVDGNPGFPVLGLEAIALLNLELSEPLTLSLRQDSFAIEVLRCGGRLLAGLVVCGACGRPMHTNVRRQADGTKVERFFCTHRFAHKGECLGSSTASIAVAALDDWVLRYLAPQISTELVGIQSRDDKEALGRRLAILQEKLSQHRRVESEKLASLIGVLDEEQLATVAQRLRSERHALEAGLHEVKSKVQAANVPVAVAEDLRSTNAQLLREALRRTINWIAVTDKGIVVCTREVGYMGAAFKIPQRGVEFRNGGKKPRMNRRELLPAVGALASQQCRGWISDPDSFVAGRRRHLDKHALHSSDRDLLPD